ncbi:hypothetical protein GCM10010987_71670 [Bradyrhizobium guangdongense]|uniref:Uncharacterized protein n=1 Tax=Bradyrhizobium guangdongense TaxID=1325090 RepID=A0AA87WF94_9BRAD|nr:hypothetical protein XH86_12230 [Bradyrhizobium guangdongense]GGI32892.1 hypothetical protein GCM10010987_71670 [Bradyrhizobium guangdongense]
MRAIGLIIVGMFAGLAWSVEAKQCPADPFLASKTIWNWGEFRTGEVRTGVHPCGRKMTCIGGKISGNVIIKRSCHWD